MSILYIKEIKCLCGGGRVHNNSKGVSCLVQASVIIWEERKCCICLYDQNWKELDGDVDTKSSYERGDAQEKNWCANTLLLGHSWLKKEDETPGMKLGFPLSVVRVPGYQRECCFFFVARPKGPSNEWIRGCIVTSGGQCRGRIQGKHPRGSRVNDFSKVTQTFPGSWQTNTTLRF